MLPKFKTLLVIVAALLLPITVSADDTAQTFKTNCLKAWVDAHSSTDKVDFKNFGEKYCECASSKPLNTPENVNSAIQICMSQTILHDTMDNLEDKVGLDNVTEDAIQAGCIEKWKVIYPQMDEKLTTLINSFCQCVTPKLGDLTKNNANVTDKQWYEQIDQISATCAPILTPDKASSVKTAGS